MQSYAYKNLNRNIVNIRYYLLNLPDTIQFGTGNQIINKYAANGQKLSTEYYTKILPLLQPLVTGEVYNWKANPGEMEKTSTLYIGNIEYETSRDDWKPLLLNRISNNEGYVDNFNVSMQNVRYNYFRRDHLGNNREVWYASYNKWERNADQMGYHTVIIPAATSQQTQYYPSGLPWAEGMGQDVQTRKYNGKEFVEMHGYDTYDIVWRQYYPAIARFQTPDPEVEEFYDLSPYSMCDNNMVNRTDPDGRFWNYIAGGVAGGLMEIGTQVVANTITGADKSINWKKVGVSSAEGALTSGGSVALKIGATVGAAFAQSALDGNEGFKDIAIGAAVNLGSGDVGSGASKLAKGVGAKGLEKTANNIVGSKTAITKSVQTLTKTSTKTARVVAKTVQNAEKAAAKEVKKSVQTTTKAAVTEASKKYYEQKK